MKLSRSSFLILPAIIVSLALTGCNSKNLRQRLGMDSKNTSNQQEQQVKLNKETGVVVVRRFNVTPGTEADFVNRWQKVADYLKLQPGYITTTMHRNSDDFKAWDNKSHWESRAEFETATSKKDYQDLVSFLPDPIDEKAFLVRRHGEGNLRIDADK